MKERFYIILGYLYYPINFILCITLAFIMLFKINFDWSILLYSIPSIALVVLSGIPFIVFVLCRFAVRSYENKILKNANRVQSKNGMPGAGKTTMTLFEAVVLAKQQWKKLQYEYWLSLSSENKVMNSDALKHNKEVIEAYNFYIEKNTIPCLWADTPIKIGNMFSNPLERDHFLQKKKLPIYSIIFSDELGDMFPARKGVCETDEVVSDTGRFIRHYFDGYWQYTEQDDKKANIGARRVCGENRYIYCQQWVLQPIILVFISKQLQKLFLKLLRKAYTNRKHLRLYKTYVYLGKLSSKYFSRFMRFLVELICHIGFRKYTFINRGNGEAKDVVTNAKKEVAFAPSYLNAEYNSRAFRNKYKAKDLEIDKDLHFFDKLILTKEFLNQRKI